MSYIDPDDPDVLTEQQRNFVERVFAGEKSTDAALKAGYKDKQSGPRLLKMSKVRRALDALRIVTMAHSVEMRAALLRFHMEVMNGDVKDVIYAKGAEVEVTARLETRQRAAGALADMLGFEIKKIELTGKDGRPIQTENETRVTNTLNTDQARDLIVKVLGVPVELVDKMRGLEPKKVPGNFDD